jgi:hypothetical protein
MWSRFESRSVVNKKKRVQRCTVRKVINVNKKRISRSTKSLYPSCQKNIWVKNTVLYCM